ncbi:hypothetical protein M3Y99_00081200 [Aphelenchoides fujianensis]|nr:hypothetical protein M3Y99_00081200 [Aphelenchoides fujianensis]
MKRHLDEVAEVEPSEKRPHYEKRISDSFDGIQLGGDSSSNSPLVADPPAEEELDIDFSEIPDFDDESPGEEPVVEEPEEGGGVELSSELRDYLQRQKARPLPPQAVSNRKPARNSCCSTERTRSKSRITEVTDDDLDLENDDENPDVCFASSTSSSSSSPRISPPPDDPNEPTEEEEMEVDEQMDVD